MKNVAGWWCPDLLSGPGSYLGRCGHLEHALKHVANCAVAIQAGGHIGTVPAYLADRFVSVYTFEPDPENFAALAANAYERFPHAIHPVRGILGQKRGTVRMFQSTKSTGQHRVNPEAVWGDTPTFRIDDLDLPRVDLIALDVEGFEIPALAGAFETLKRCRPVVMAEENKRSVEQGYAAGELEVAMRMAGYVTAGRIADDWVFVPAERA